MDRSLWLLIIGLIFGGGIGFVTAAGNGITLDGHVTGWVPACSRLYGRPG